MQERRKLNRRDLVYYLRVFDSSAGQFLGHVANISTEGVMLISERPFEALTTFPLKVILHMEIGGKKHLEFEAQSRWCKRDGSNGFFDSGFKLKNLPTGDLDIIARICAKPGLQGRHPITLKRIFDVLVSFFGLLLCSPLFLLIGFVLRLESPAPIFYSASRVGRFGRLFHMYKFRTMVEAPEGKGPKITAHDDPRITRIGRFLRRTKLNELPQLFNVFKGEMSFVGPRPEERDFVAEYTPEQREVLAVKPGITSLASIIYSGEEQILRFTDATETYLRSILPDKLRLDLIYKRNQSMLLDIDILLQTMLVLLPRFRSAAPKVENILLGPLRKAQRYLPCLVIDAIIAFLAIGAAGVNWRSAGPLDVGFGRSLIAAILMTALFSATNWLTGIQRVQWRYASAIDSIGVFGSAIAATLLVIIINSLIPPPHFPIEMLIVAGLLAAGGFLAARYHAWLLLGLGNILHQLRVSPAAGRERVLIVGAGDAGQLTTWLLRNNPATRAFHAVGILDDDLNKLGTLIHRVPVIGTCDHISEIVHEKDISVIIFAVHCTDQERRQRILESCQKTSARIVVAPDPLTLLRQNTPSGAVLETTGSDNGAKDAQQFARANLRLRDQIHSLAGLARMGDIARVARGLDRLDKALELEESAMSGDPPKRLQSRSKIVDQSSPSAGSTPP